MIKRWLIDIAYITPHYAVELLLLFHIDLELTFPGLKSLLLSMKMDICLMMMLLIPTYDIYKVASEIWMEKRPHC